MPLGHSLGLPPAAKARQLELEPTEFRGAVMTAARVLRPGVCPPCLRNLLSAKRIGAGLAPMDAMDGASSDLNAIDSFRISVKFPSLSCMSAPLGGRIQNATGKSRREMEGGVCRR